MGQQIHGHARAPRRRAPPTIVPFFAAAHCSAVPTSPMSAASASVVVAVPSRQAEPRARRGVDDEEAIRAQPMSDAMERPCGRWAGVLLVVESTSMRQSSPGLPSSAVPPEPRLETLARRLRRSRVTP